VMEAVIEGRSVVIVLLDSVGKLTRVADAKRVKSWMEATAAERVQVSMR
jgi:D-alanyl-D-alanine endopeptidase (penicillin-binding protein 7)